MRFVIIDCGGLHVSTAVKLGKDGHEVYYYCPWQSAYPKFLDGAPGTGIPEIKKILDYGPHIDDADCIVFPDVGAGELAEQLRRQGKVVFGAGLGEVLEQDRGKCVQILQKFGLICPETHIVHGVDEALAKLAELFQLTETNQSATGKYFIKLNVWRGSFESFPAENLEIAEFMFDSLKSSMGPYANSVEITIQKTVEGIECGADLFFNGSEFVKPYMMGFESGGSYVGYMTDDLGPFKADMDQIAKYLKSVNYRGAFSFECFFDGKVCSYIDITTRFPMPLGMMYAEFADDFGALLHEIATGKATSSRLPKGQFLGCVDISTEEAGEKWMPLIAGENTRFVRYFMDHGKCFAVPGISWVATAITQGSTMEEVQSKLQAELKECNIFFSKGNEKFVDEIREKYIEPLKELGYDFDAIISPPTIKKEGTLQKPLQKKTLRDRYVQLKQWKEAPVEGYDPVKELGDVKQLLKESTPPKVFTQRQDAFIREEKKPTSTPIFKTPVDKYGIPKL